MDRLALDTTFLIDAQNERRSRGPKRGATAFLEANPDLDVLLPSVALGEYIEGFENPRCSTTNPARPRIRSAARRPGTRRVLRGPLARAYVVDRCLRTQPARHC